MNIKRIALLLDLSRVFRYAGRDDRELWKTDTRDLRRLAHKIGLTRPTHRRRTR